MSKFSSDSSEDLMHGWQSIVRQLQTGWTDDLIARWFSWFLAGAAKHTWQHTLSREGKMQWNSIVASYRGHYGVHMEPRMAYLRCHGLQYRNFCSVQGLLEAMKDY